MVGQTISHYQIVEKLGRGGMGVVYKARDTKLDRTLALKFLPPDMSASEETKQRFIQEAKAASALDHPNICTIHDIGETESGELYIVMAYYEGQTLGDRLESGDVSIDDSIDIIAQLARALDRAHEAGIVHRDIKPANIMVSDRGEVKLLDFGLAKLTSGLDLTKEGSTLGTAAYMSPEQARSENVDEGSDIWSLGVVFYELLAGRKPFESAYDQALMYTILNEDPPPIQDLRPDVPDDIAELVSTCLAKTRADRPGSMADVVTALSESTAETTPIVLQESADAVRISKRMIMIVGAGLVALVMLVFALTQEGAEPAIVISDDTIAVLPFSVRGSDDLAYLGEGMVDLISEKLDGAGPLETVNPRLLIALLKNENIDPTDPSAGAQAASLVGAGRFITGDVLQVGSQIRLTAYMNDTERPDDPLETSTVETIEDELLSAVDSLAVDLLSDSFAGSEGRIQREGAITAASLPAAKAFLRGEKAVREGLFREAAAAYAMAVELDSTFALAYYRNSVAAEWIDAPEIRELADRAIEFSDQLSPQDQSLLAALHLRRNGWSDLAEKEYRIHLSRYLDDVEATVQLGEILFHENPRRGRPTFDSKPAFDRILEVEPNNHIAQIHAARLEALVGDIKALKKRAAYFREDAPDSERALEVDAIIAHVDNDTLRQAEIIEILKSKPHYYTFYVIHGVVRYARDVHGASRIMDERVTEDPLVTWFIPQLMAMKGQMAEVESHMSRERDQTNPSLDLYEAFVLTSGVVPANPDRLETLMARIERADPEQTRLTGIIMPHDDITDEFLKFEAAYFRALILVNLDRLDEARAILEEMKAHPAFPGLGSMHADITSGLEAEISYRSGDHEAALAHLRSIQYEIPHAAAVRSIADGTRSRYLRAELELAIGDLDTAKGFYLGLDESWSPFDSYYRAPVYIRLSEIAESEGRIDDAVLNYERLLEMWEFADPVILPSRSSAQERLDALRSAREREPSDIPTPTQ